MPIQYIICNNNNNDNEILDDTNNGKKIPALCNVAQTPSNLARGKPIPQTKIFKRIDDEMSTDYITSDNRDHVMLYAWHERFFRIMYVWHGIVS